ncbi:MAG: protein-tyrosine-phosphatase [Alphaproteobacteria bacterium]|nr:protein-tyrosine-phosphatase [Alphaproteobacteria bacterium]
MRLWLACLCLIIAAPSAHAQYALSRSPAGELILSWSGAPAPAAVAVSHDPSGFDAADFTPVGAHSGSIAIDTDSVEGRPYVRVRTLSGSEHTVAERLLPLEGGKNFRDLGGYETADGRRVRWGQLYRSGVMTGLTEGDYRYLSHLGIGVVCDLRASSERVAEPTDWRAGPVQTLAWDYEIDTAVFAAAFSGGLSEENSVAAFSGFYRDMPGAFADRFAALFDMLEAGGQPAAFHCSAGKDRTGVAAALILTALGVPRETILADYALSDTFVDYMADIEASRASIDPEDPAAFWVSLPDEVLAPFMRSDPAYLAAALDQIEADHGSVDAYLTGVLGADLERLRALYLE